MSMNVDNLVLKRFTTLYGLPTTDDQEGFLEEYRTALTGTDPRILKPAIDLAIKRQEVPAWPPVGACSAAVREISDRQYSERRLEFPKEEEYCQPTPESRARVQALVDGLVRKLRMKVEE